MSDKRPLVLSSTGAIQQLQRPDDVDAPAVDRLEDLERRFKLLVNWMAFEGFDVPDEVINSP